MLGDVQRVHVGRAVAPRRIANALITGMRRALQIRLPADSAAIKLADHARLIDAVHPVRIVAGDAERRTAEQADVVGLAGMADSEVIRGQAVLPGKRIQVRCGGVADDVAETVVLLDDDEDVVIVRWDRSLRAADDRRRGGVGHAQAVQGDNTQHQSEPSEYAHRVLPLAWRVPFPGRTTYEE